MSGTTRDNEWQQMTTRDNEWQLVASNDKWQQIVILANFFFFPNKRRTYHYAP